MNESEQYILRQVVRELVSKARPFGSKKKGLPREKQWYSITIRGNQLDLLKELAGDNGSDLKEAIEALRQAHKNSEWVQMDDPYTELQKLRHGSDWEPKAETENTT